MGILVNDYGFWKDTNFNMLGLMALFLILHLSSALISGDLIIKKLDQLIKLVRRIQVNSMEIVCGMNDKNNT